MDAQIEKFTQLLAVSDKMSPEDKKTFLALHDALERQKKITVVEFNKTKYSIAWRPQPRQLSFLKACGLSYAYDKAATNKPLAKVIGYGGAAGGGKSDALLGIAFLAAFRYPKCNIGYFRREYPQLEGPGGAIMRSQQLFSGIAKWNGSQLRWTFPTGAILEFCHCKNEADMYNYQSQQFDIILFDEGTQFTRTIYRFMLTRNRATVDGGFTPFIAIGTNPGNVGHVWFKDEFVDIGTPEIPHEVEVEPGKFETHVFIPAKLADNQILETRDPGYRKSLEAQAEDIRRMMLDGDFDVAQGRYFPEFKRHIHTVAPFEIPPEWKRYRTLDYGLDMLACYWIAVDTKGNEYVYKVARGSDLIIRDAARKILQVNGRDNVICTYAPPDMWNRRQDTGKSAAEIFAQNGVPFVKARNDRVNGWYAMKDRLKPIETKNEQTGEDITTSAMLIFNTMADLIKSIINIQKDDNNPNDCANEPHDLTHDPDAIRYYCGMRQSATTLKAPPQAEDFEHQRPRPDEFSGGAIDTSYINF